MHRGKPKTSKIIAAVARAITGHDTGKCRVPKGGASSSLRSCQQPPAAAAAKARTLARPAGDTKARARAGHDFGATGVME
jgi:hypothetical protein